jgi:hypothetical protein
MPKMDGTGPNGQGSNSGRKLGNCSTSTDKEKQNKLGMGTGTGRQSGKNAGKGKRLQSGSKL